MVRERSLEIWHIPKRGSIHQIIGALNIIDHFDIDGKSWSGTRRKLFDQKFAMWGFTSRSRSLSKNASETLEALIKYLGLLIIDEERKIRITPAGKALIREFPIKEPEKKKRPLKETERIMGDISSNVLKKQMMKLILTNPSILVYCKNIKIAPFRETLHLLIDNELSYLAPEEMAMFLFHMKDRSQRLKIKEKILHFRSLNSKDKDRVIDKYKNTPEGNITLKQAPTAAYWRQLCMNTGLFEVKKQALRLIPDKKEEAKRLLKKYGEEIYNFKDNLFLWYEYFRVPKRIKQPINISLRLINIGSTEYLVMVLKNNQMIKGSLVDEDKIFEVQIFPEENYRIQIIDLETGDKVKDLKKSFIQEGELLEIDLPKKKIPKPDKFFYGEKINEHITSSDFDIQYKRNLKIVGDHLKKNFLNKKNRAWLRGGRLEFLFAKLLDQIQSERRVSKLHWNGSIDDFGIVHPAPGLKSGLPDISFKCGPKYYLLELTTIPAASAQWRAEGSSVPFHIRNYINNTGIKDVTGIFCSPKVHKRVDDALKSSLIPYKYDIISISIEDFVDILINSLDIEKAFMSILKEQYNR